MSYYDGFKDNIILVENDDDVIQSLHNNLTEYSEDFLNKDIPCRIIFYSKNTYETQQWFYEKVKHIPNVEVRVFAREITLPRGVYKTTLKFSFKDSKLLETGEARQRHLGGMQLAAAVILDDVKIHDQCDYYIFTKLRYKPSKIYTLKNNFKTINSLFKGVDYLTQ